MPPKHAPNLPDNVTHGNSGSVKRQKVSHATSQSLSSHGLQELVLLRDCELDGGVDDGERTRTVAEIEERVSESQETEQETEKGVNWDKIPIQVVCCMPPLPPTTEEQKREYAWAAAHPLPDEDDE